MAKYQINWLALIALFLPTLGHGASSVSVLLDDGVEVPVTRHGADGNDLLLWLPSEAGAQAIDAAVAAQLNDFGIEVWRVDLLGARFLPTAQSSMDKVPASDFKKLIERAALGSDKDIYIVTTGRGAIPVLRGSRAWQQGHPVSTRLRGLILISPKLYLETPNPGVAAQFMPIVTRTNLAIYILQPDLSPWYWKLDKIIPALEQGGSDLFVRILRGVRDRYYFRPDAMPGETQAIRRFPGHIYQGMKFLASLPKQTRAAVQGRVSTPKVREGKKARTLKPYPDQPKAPPLVLTSLTGRSVDLEQFMGKVVLVNFWASWCPPCVKEMPSMQRLSHKMSLSPFLILAVNMAEERATIIKFLSTVVSVEFQILLDIDGKALKRWGVFAFPTSYIIGKRGRIRYALFGSIQWDAKDVVDKISALANEPS